MTPTKTLLTALTLLAGGLAHAEVRDASAGAFFIENSVAVTASAAQAYIAATRKIAQWWDPAHTWSGSARNLSIDARPGGCFCESLPGGGVQHARVIYVQPGKMLRMEGALGPLQDMAVSGVLTFTFVPEGAGSRIALSYRVAGAQTLDGAKLAPLVDRVLAGQLARLQSFANTGKPDSE